MLEHLISQASFYGLNAAQNMAKPVIAPIKHGFSLKSIALKNELSRLQKRKESLTFELSQMDGKIASVESRIKMIENEGNP